MEGISPTAPSPFLPADRLALEDLVAEHWARTDRVVDRPVSDLYVDSGRMQIGRLACDGRDAISAYFAERRAQEDQTLRKTRHFVANFAVELASGVEARVRFLCLVFAGVGDLPLAVGPPTTIADFSADCVKSLDGAWAFQNVSAALVFTGAGTPPFAQ